MCNIGEAAARAHGCNITVGTKVEMLRPMLAAGAAWATS